MTSTDDFERRMADHYQNEAPLRAPNWLLTQALAAIETTPQRRTLFGRPWRLASIGSFAKLAVGAGAIVAVVAVGATVLRVQSAGPGATAAPAPSSLPSVPPPLTERFDSTLNGISIDYPAGWLVRPATEPWTEGVLNFDSSAADVIFDPDLGNRLYLAVASQPSARTGTAGPDWGDICGSNGGGSSGSIKVDGASASVMNCGSGSNGVEITTGTRGYLIRMFVSEEEMGLRKGYDADWFAEVLKTVDLRPDAPAASKPSESP